MVREGLFMTATKSRLEKSEATKLLQGAKVIGMKGMFWCDLIKGIVTLSSKGSMLITFAQPFLAAIVLLG